MTAATLIESIATEIKAATSKIKLPVEYQDEEQRRSVETWQAVQIFRQYIPKDLYTETTYYPCVVVELVEINDVLRGDEIKSVAVIGLSVGVFAKEYDGWKDSFHLLEVIRQRLLSVRMVSNLFRLAGDVTWRNVPQQPTPFYFWYAELEYEIFQPQEPRPLEEKMLTPDLITTEPAKILKVEGFKRRIK